jgi:glutamine synthetase
MDDFEKHSKEQLEIIKEISVHIESINSNITNMIEARKKANKI